MRCPESLIILRNAHLLAGTSKADHFFDFLHDVSSMSTSLNAANEVSGNKAIYLLEVVIGGSKQFSAETTAGKLLFDEKTKPYLTSSGQWDLVGLTEHQQKLLNTEELQGIFHKWIATQTRLRIFWISDLSQETKLRLYRDLIRDRFRILARAQKDGGFFEDPVRISFTEEMEEKHCTNLSPQFELRKIAENQELRELKEVRHGTNLIFEATGFDKLREVLESCRHLYRDQNIRDFSITCSRKNLLCDRMQID